MKRLITEPNTMGSRQPNAITKTIIGYPILTDLAGSSTDRARLYLRHLAPPGSCQETSRGTATTTGSTESYLLHRLHQLHRLNEESPLLCCCARDPSLDVPYLRTRSAGILPAYVVRMV